jgi:hypothetical protein
MAMPLGRAIQTLFGLHLVRPTEGARRPRRRGARMRHLSGLLAQAPSRVLELRPRPILSEPPVFGEFVAGASVAWVVGVRCMLAGMPALVGRATGRTAGLVGAFGSAAEPVSVGWFHRRPGIATLESGDKPASAALGAVALTSRARWL